ncbi:MAG: AsnC family transcriptional regulator [Candidatus Aquicultor secundus]|uniref:RrF2 family transcriptional regulator n=2 Tax=Candidatus Aquicultor secundus TaxID=1973895 RepID=UPI00091435EE|nr:Rrf2 family transcriptional regulator [Candidatus Aquicultor secundus]OIO87868.1 MAG: hypothetical protein AUK32_02875 [Candidatus Aquicultor secundus]PIW21390.1 MAG: AsnC family transcriptional regulator [Candidatus Aquicultor secundus]
MQLTRRAEYGIRAMVDLAANSESQPIMSKDIAARQDIPVKFLVQIVPDLKSAGLIYTVRGNGGGIYLGKRPVEINLRQIVEAIEGPIALNQCLLGENGCTRKPGCAIHDVWRQAQSQMLSVLESTTLARLVETKKAPQTTHVVDSVIRVSNETEVEV